MLNQRGGAKVETVFKVVMVFFMALLAFSVGTIVGKQLSDVNHKKAALEGEESEERGTASIPEEASKVEPTSAIPEDELERLAQTHESDIDEPAKPAADHNSAESHKAEHGTHAEAAKENAPAHSAEKPAAAEHGAHAEEAKKHKKADEHGKGAGEEKAPKGHEEAKKSASVQDDYTQYAQKIAKNEHIVAPKAKPAREVASLPNEVGQTMVGKITVQIGSFQTEGEAKNKVNDLKEKGISAFYVPATIKGKTWYRVGSGAFDKKDEAIEFQKKLAKDYGLPNTILNKIAPN